MPITGPPATRRLRPGARREEIRRLLEAAGSALSVAEVAAQVGLHANTARAHLDELVRTGHVERRSEHRAAPGRPRELYTALAVDDGTRHYRMLAEMLAAGLASVEGGAAAATAGARSWTDRPIDRSGTADPPSDSATQPPTLRPEDADGLGPVLDLLDRHGFAPALSTDGDAIELHHCPFLEVARERSDVVCGAHLGLIQGALDRARAPLEATGITPFVRPGLCVATLGRRPS
ncbi:metalloregulator ArsR/SmtB family transcription factor [Actinotalea sp. C106]|uniref:helix-turn-helix transcriptional regulator n=1 Tax=Actinotalea sp. C106 TaxID=2908644 RepID=UPI0020295531|nr:helix-turn-helix domain-containing protein [Actinotalea sp. C106]